MQEPWSELVVFLLEFLVLQVAAVLFALLVSGVL